MLWRVKVTADSQEDLRRYLEGSGADLGCRPMAFREAEGISIVLIADRETLDRLSARRSAGRRLVRLEALGDPKARTALCGSRNRFLKGERPRGYGERVDS